MLEISELRKGWFILPGQDGDRILEDQILALEPALAECAGKTVLDLGCAEGLIGREFARAGALMVHGIDSVAGHIEVAEEQCAGLPMTFEVCNLGSVETQPPQNVGDKYDIVLALGVIHKLRFPEQGLRYAASKSSGLLLLRSGRGAVNGIITSKGWPANKCNSHAVLLEMAMRLTKVVPGPKQYQEDVEYWGLA